jgi:hypothetical protein
VTEETPPGEEPSVPPEAAPAETPQPAPSSETEPPAEEAPSIAAETEAPPAPTAPPFRSEAIVVQELDSSGLGELRYFEEPVDPEWIGKRVEYAVAYSNRQGRQSALSPVARVDAASVLPPPGTPALEAQQGLVAVKWGVPPDAPPDLAFSVHRRLEEAKVYPDAPLNPEPVTAASFEDRTAVFGVASCYVVSAVLGPSGSVSSLPSEEACITPRDIFPPEAPSGLVAVPSDGAVLLSWSEVEADDLKAYRVYRGESPEGTFELLAEVAQSSYTDTNAASDETYYYAVTAIDDAAGTNESVRSETVEARLSRERYDSML